MALRHDDGLIFDHYPYLVTMNENSQDIIAPNHLRLVNRQLYHETRNVLRQVNDTFTFGKLDSIVYYAHDGQIGHLYGSMAWEDRALYIFAHFAQNLTSPVFSNMRCINISLITPLTNDFLAHLTTIFLKDDFRFVERFCSNSPTIRVTLILTSPDKCAYAIEKDLNVLSSVLDRFRGNPYRALPNFTTSPPLTLDEFSVRLDDLVDSLDILRKVTDMRMAGYRRSLPKNLRVEVRMSGGVEGSGRAFAVCEQCVRIGRPYCFAQVYPHGC
jgi:hypothetical protein